MTWRIGLATTAMFAVTAVLLFGAAGTLYWRDGWWFMALFIGACVAITLWLAGYDPALLAARANVGQQEGQPRWDRIVIRFVQLIYWSWIVLMGLDGGRFGWSGLPDWLIWVGRAGILVGFWGVYRTFRENSFGAPVVRIQAERGHKVISTGPYAIVRHPMYASAAVMLVSMALSLNSAWGALAAIFMEFGLTFRIRGEEQLLRDGLPGYTEYTQRVRWRLIPFVW